MHCNFPRLSKAVSTLLPAALVACGGGEPLAQDSAALSSPIPIDSRRSLAVTDTAILDDRFAFTRVLDQLAATSGAAGVTGASLYAQWWDLQNDAAHAQGPGSHCDDGGVAEVNGFPVECPRQEGLLAARDPGGRGPDTYHPIGLFNRFDLAPEDGAHCGEYRIIFGKGRVFPVVDRNLIIFEAQLPNPDPARGLDGCAPIVGFWAGLSALDDPARRARRLEAFYFEGIDGVGPVVHFDNYTAATGQIRTNQFMPGRRYFDLGLLGQQWQLREFVLVPGCNSGCIGQVTVKENPFGGLFDDTSGLARAADFQDHFIGEVGALAVNDIDRFHMLTPDDFNGGESTSQGADNDYRAQLEAGTGAFASRIQNELSALGSALTPANIADRATATSCAGCHQLSSDVDLGGGLTFPASLGFVHVSETQTEGCDAADPGEGECFEISPALKDVFLPARKSVMQAFLRGLPRPRTAQRVH